MNEEPLFCVTYIDKNGEKRETEVTAENKVAAAMILLNTLATKVERVVPKMIDNIGLVYLKRDLLAIKTRYFRPTIARKEGMVTHWGDCCIFRADAPVFCSCGLNHELKNLQGMAEKLNPRYWEEYVKQEGGIQATPEEIEKVLENVFGQIPSKQNDFEWKIIGEVFGNDYVEYLKGKR